MCKGNIKGKVMERYGKLAEERGKGCCCGGTCFADYKELGQEVEKGSYLGLGCGIPTRYAQIRKGDVVLDLGSGAGVDVFLAAKAVGAKGRVIGVDMTPQMVERARENADRGGYTNVEFKLGDIESLPLDDNSVDVAISNCVINLAPDKRAVFSELYRVLRPGGRFFISDIVSYGVIPKKIRSDLNLWAGCIAGAMDRDEYLKIIGEIGFASVKVIDSLEEEVHRGKGYGMQSVTIEGKKYETK